jgi:RNA polymerase sigma-70 factor (ECF subfamily)
MEPQVTASSAMAADERWETARAGEGSLIEAALAGDGLAYRRLVEPHLGMLHRIATRVSGDRHLAEDAVQETLTLAYKRLGTYRHDMPFRAYLAAVAAKQAHTLARTERRRRGREKAADAPERADNPEEALRGARAARRVRQALAAMPDKRREATLLRLDAGLSYQDIALALGSSEGSTRVLVHAALKELRSELADLLEVPGESPGESSGESPGEGKVKEA